MKKESVGLLELETAVLECFLEKTPLSPLGVNNEIYKHHGEKLINHLFVKLTTLYKPCLNVSHIQK
jgi:hypothetical protein